MLTLYYSPIACSMASHIILEEIGEPYEAIPVHILKEEHKLEKYLKLNPRARVPSLIMDGKILTETVAILTYLARRFPHKKLLPADHWDEAQCLSTMAWLSSAVHPTFRHFGRPERFATDPVAFSTIKETGRQTFWSYCFEIDELLKDKQYLMGDQFTVADPYLLIFYGWFFLPERPIGLSPEKLSHYTTFVKRMAQRPAVRQILKREQSPLTQFI